MAKDVIGHIKCPYCDYDDAEVKETKKVFQSRAVVMVWCPHPKCQSQYFPRSKEGSDRIRNKMREVSGAVINNPPREDAPAATVPLVVDTKPVKKSFAQELGLE